ncbi:sensor domain-containing diguanylate cyclase [Castellaniella defragrans]|nr:sensor domain-containing diguanylate cyclase [Castellaniella defragrans]
MQGIALVTSESSMLRSFRPSASPFSSRVLLISGGLASAGLLMVVPAFCHGTPYLWLAILPACGFLALFVFRERAREACRAKFAALRARNDRQRKRVHSLRGQARVLRAISRRRPLDESMGILCRFVEDRIPGARCSVLMLGPEGRTVGKSVAPGLPEPYNQALLGLEIGPAVGSCGAAMHLRKPVFIDDVLRHPNWAPFRDLVLTTGMRACWSSPILDDDGQAVGAFAVYNEQPRLPVRGERLTIHVAVEMARVAVNMAAVYRQLMHQSLRDELTGLANRRGMKDWLTRRLEAGGRVGVLLLDLDDFKPVNDTFGHDGGDKVLRVVAGRLRDLVGRDAIASRLGGDEFTLGVPTADPAALEDIARRVIEAVGRPVSIDRRHRARVRCSIGIARHPEDGETVEELMTHADLAMYEAKKSGKNRYRRWSGPAGDGAEMSA